MSPFPYLKALYPGYCGGWNASWQWGDYLVTLNGNTRLTAILKGLIGVLAYRLYRPLFYRLW